MAASSAGVSTVEAGLGPRTASSVLVRRRHLRTVLGLRPKRVASVCTPSVLCWIKRRVAGVVVAQPCGIFPIGLLGRYGVNPFPHSPGLYS